MPRRERQRDEIDALCRGGHVDRAIDLAFVHFADFGPDEELLVLLADTAATVGTSAAVRRRCDELVRAWP